ncbi:unannotated protein [freshwater metagenome]|uniref:Unannotated protein n=1 Tax=freshwater metagenome TaxID=449393 RepID=A0A6J7KKX8_9ZZZZ
MRTGIVAREASVAITSSASKPATPMRGTPSADSTCMMTGTWGLSVSGTSSASGSSTATLCALYDGIASTRKLGRQSSSQHATRCVGEWSVTSRRMKSRNPRTAFTGVPSGATVDSGTPW